MADIKSDSLTFVVGLGNRDITPEDVYKRQVQGKVLELDKVLTIGVVGTRNSSEYGRVVTDRICRELAQYGAVTIGGLARGIDLSLIHICIKNGVHYNKIDMERLV